MRTGGPLFTNNDNRHGSSNEPRHLVEMRAGKMNLRGRMVYPDKRKGTLYVYQGFDYLMHFCWKDRTTGAVEDDLIIFPDDCEYVRVPQCTTGRVYLLRFNSSSRRFFFWLQEPHTDRDDEHCRRINELLNNPSSATSYFQSPDQFQDWQHLLSHISQPQFNQMFGRGTNRSSLSNSTRGSTPTTSSSSTNQGAANLNAVAATSTNPPVAAAPSRSSSPQDANANARQIHLANLQNYIQEITATTTQGQQNVSPYPTNVIGSVRLGPVVSQVTNQDVTQNAERKDEKQEPEDKTKKAINDKRKRGKDNDEDKKRDNK